MSGRLPEIEARLHAEYRTRTERSRALYERALGCLPGGDTRTGTFFLPYPIFAERGAGCLLHDVDGNRYVDFLNNFTSLVHGHAHPRITAAIAEQASKGSVYAIPVELQLELAEELSRRIPSIERVRFANSGTEAVMNAVRAARAFTGRPKLLKMEGGYHGTYDAVEVSIDPGPDGPAWPEGTPDEPGLSPALTRDVLVAPFNDLETTADLIGRHRAELAAVIVEPVMGHNGMIPAEAAFLRGLRAATRAHGVLLIVDEIITLRLATGGAQELYGVDPDLTTLGKLIGGGLPIGAFGGHAEVMSLFDPRQPGRISHSGTFNGSPACLAAGRVALELLRPAEIARINGLGDVLRSGAQGIFHEVGVSGHATGSGSLVQIHLTDAPVRDYRSAVASPRWFRGLVHLALLNRGIFCGPKASFNISTAMDESKVQQALEALREVVKELMPVLVPFQLISQKKGK